MTDIDSLHGSKLDEYGKSIGIERYQGLGAPESDEDYKKAIRNHVTKGQQTSTSIDVDSIQFHSSVGYAVVWNKRDDDYAGVCEGGILKIYETKEEAQNEKLEWDKGNSLNGFYTVEEVKITWVKRARDDG